MRWQQEGGASAGSCSALSGRATRWRCSAGSSRSKVVRTPTELTTVRQGTTAAPPRNPTTTPAAAPVASTTNDSTGALTSTAPPLASGRSQTLSS